MFYLSDLADTPVFLSYLAFLDSSLRAAKVIFIVCGVQAIVS